MLIHSQFTWVIVIFPPSSYTGANNLHELESPLPTMSSIIANTRSIGFNSFSSIPPLLTWFRYLFFPHFATNRLPFGFLIAEHIEKSQVWNTIKQTEIIRGCEPASIGATSSRPTAWSA